MSEYNLLIGGRLESGDSTMAVINPATEELLANCPRASADQLEAAVAAANQAFPSWSTLAIEDRRALLYKLADVVDANADALVRLITQEVGKPLTESAVEVREFAFYTRYYASLDLPVRVLEDSPQRKVELHRRPLGVVAAILPWNFPLLMLALKMPPALLAGNTVVVKTAPTAPLAVLKLGELLAAIFPAGVVNILAEANDLGDALTCHPGIRKISFTGSTQTGKRIMANAANTLKRITLELGGNDAAILLDDVDPDTTAEKVFKKAFANAGQACLGVKRLYVHDGIYDAVCSRLAQLANAVKVGDGMEPETQIGPLQNRAQFERVTEYLADGRANGTIIAGGDVPDRPGYFVRPTIVRDIEEGCRLVDEEQFGPILPVIRYSDPEDALRRANATPYGLGGSVWSASPERALKLARRLNVGTAWVNAHLDHVPVMPAGGAKISGIGVVLGEEEGIAEFTQQHVVDLVH